MRSVTAEGQRRASRSPHLIISDQGVILAWYGRVFGDGPRRLARHDAHPNGQSCFRGAMTNSLKRQWAAMAMTWSKQV